MHRHFPCAFLALAFACLLPHSLAADPGDAPEEGAVTSWLPGERVDENVMMEDGLGYPIRLGWLVDRAKPKAIVLWLFGGAEAIPVANRGGLWCEDSHGDLSLMRFVALEMKKRDVLFIPIACPPVHHAERFGFAKDAFLTKADNEPAYRRSRGRFVQRTQELAASDALPFPTVYFDPRLLLLGDPKDLGPKPVTGRIAPWQGKFKWHEDTQTYGTPTTWVLGPDLTVHGEPFHGNVWEAEGRQLRYSAGDVIQRIEEVLAASSS